MLLCWAGYQKSYSRQNIFPSIVREQTLRATLGLEHRSPLLEAGGDKFKLKKWHGVSSPLKELAQPGIKESLMSLTVHEKD